MSISNLLSPNHYNIFAESITLENGQAFDTFYQTIDTPLTMHFEDETTATVLCSFIRIGKVVHMYVDYNSKALGTVTRANRYISQQIPVAFRPTTGTGNSTYQFQSSFCTNNGTNGFGLFNVKNNGTCDFYVNADMSTQPANSTTVTFYRQVYTWFIE
jgi:hypothetical protein